MTYLYNIPGNVTNRVTAAADFNQFISILSRQAGQTEPAAYLCGGNAYTTGGFVSFYVSTLNKVATPVSASIDTSISSPNNVNSPTTANLAKGGVDVHATSTAAAANCNAGGLCTVQY